jgi:hypothetical protein
MLIQVITDIQDVVNNKCRVAIIFENEPREGRTTVTKEGGTTVTSANNTMNRAMECVRNGMRAIVVPTDEYWSKLVKNVNGVAQQQFGGIYILHNNYINLGGIIFTNSDKYAKQWKDYKCVIIDNEEGSNKRDEHGLTFISPYIQKKIVKV